MPPKARRKGDRAFILCVQPMRLVLQKVACGGGTCHSLQHGCVPGDWIISEMPAGADDFRRNLDLALKAAGETPASLARKLDAGLDKSTIGRWLKGTKPRTTSVIPKIEAQLRVENLHSSFSHFLMTNPSVNLFYSKMQIIDQITNSADEQFNSSIHDKFDVLNFFPASNLGEIADNLEGIWRLCYIAPVSPPAEARKKASERLPDQRQIRESLVFFKNVQYKYCKLLYVSSNRQWIGRSYGHETRLFTVFSQATHGRELSYMVSNAPIGRDLVIAGMLVVLDNFSEADRFKPRGAYATFAACEKSSHEEVVRSILEVDPRLSRDTIIEVVDRACLAEPLEESEAQIIRKAHVRYNRDDLINFNKKNPLISRYLTSITIHDHQQKIWDDGDLFNLYMMRMVW